MTTKAELWRRAEADLAEYQRAQHQVRLLELVKAAEAMAAFLANYEFGVNTEVDELLNAYRDARAELGKP